MPDPLITSNLRFACAGRDDLAAIRRGGLPAGSALFDDLTQAIRRCAECIVVVRLGDGSVAAPDHVENTDPYRAPVEVVAGGGFLIRERRGKLDILLIHRRGVWDLPKGKLDEGESVEECARREVCEELGIEAIEIVRPLGRTVHGYVDGDSYAVKSTHWYEMSTTAEAFTPQRKEQIEKVEWVPLAAAHDRLGFDTLRRHLAAVEPLFNSNN